MGSNGIEEASTAMNHKKSTEEKLGGSNPEVAIPPIFLQPGETVADSPKTPQTQHAENSIPLDTPVKQASEALVRERGYDVESKPSGHVSPSDSLWIIDEEVRCLV